MIFFLMILVVLFDLAVWYRYEFNLKSLNYTLIFGAFMGNPVGIFLGVLILEIFGFRFGIVYKIVFLIMAIGFNILSYQIAKKYFKVKIFDYIKFLAFCILLAICFLLCLILSGIYGEKFVMIGFQVFFYTIVYFLVKTIFVMFMKGAKR